MVNEFLTVCLSSECIGFEDDWKQKKMENTTELKTPVTYGTAITIRCTTGYKKLSGPDAVTCIENTTFYGLDDVKCYSEYTITFSLGC